MDDSYKPADAKDLLPGSGALLGLDFGTRRLGIAISNSDQTIAVPVENWQVRTPAADLKYLRELIADYRCVGWVIGLPIRTNGEEGTAAAKVREFGDWIARETGLPIIYVDERYSSAEAELLVWSQGRSPSKRDEPFDSLAAKVILQSFLDDRTRAIAPRSA